MNKDTFNPHILRALEIVISLFRGIAAVMLIGFVITGCAPTVTSVDQLNGALKWKSSILEGGNQTVLPKRTLDAPIVVQILDADGKPVRDASIEATLVEIEATEKVEDLLGADVLQKKWDDKLTQSLAARAGAVVNGGNPSTAAVLASEEDEKLGRIEKLDARTDETGKAKIWLRSSALFNKSVRLIVRAGQSGVFGATYTSTIITTNDYKSGAKLSLYTTNNLVEKAGVPFEMNVAVEDIETGKTLKNFEGSHILVFEAAPTPSWAGIMPEFPVGEINCKFIGGQCLLPKSPFLLVTPETLSVKVSFKEGIIPPTNNQSIKVTPNGEKASLVLKNHAGALRDDSRRIIEINKPAGQETSLTAAWIDVAGNYIEDASNVTWNIDNALLRIGTNFTGNPTTINFRPLKTGIGYMELVSESKKTLKPIKLTIPAGPFVQWGVRIANQLESPSIVAGECPAIDVFAADANLNVNSDINLENFQIRLTIQNGDLPPYVSKRAFLEGAGSGQNVRTMNVKFKNGEASGIEKACLFDAKTTINPKIKVETGPSAALHTGFVGLSERIEVNKGSASRMGLVFNDGTGKHVCWSYNSDNFQDKDDPCIVEEVAELPAHTQYLEFKTVVFDSAGNVVGYPASLWEQQQNTNQLTSTNPLFGIQVPGGTASTVTSIAANAAWRLRLNTVIDQGVLNTLRGVLATGQFNTLSGTAREVQYSIFVSPRKPARAEVIPCVGTSCSPRGSGVKSTEPFGVRLRFLDASNNPVTAFVTRPADGYPRKKLYRLDKPTGELTLALTNREEAQQLSVDVSSNTIVQTPKAPRQGLLTEGSFTPGTVDYEANMLQTTPVDTDSYFSFPPSSTLKFESYKVIPGQQISGTLRNMVIGGQDFGASYIIPVESALFPILPGDPWHFKAVDPNNSFSTYQDSLGSKIVIQQSPVTLNVHLAKSVVVWGIDKYNNEIQVPQPVTYEWKEANTVDPGFGFTCNASGTGGEGHIASPMITIPTGSTTPDTRFGDGATETTQITPDSDHGNRIYLNAPCARRGRLKIMPVNSGTYEPTFLTFNGGQKSKLPEIEFVGDLEHHFYVQAISTTSADPYKTATAATMFDGLGSGVEAGTAFYLRLIPVVENGSNHVKTYTGVKQIRLSGVNNVSWANTSTNILPPSLGQTYYCDFQQQTAMEPIYKSGYTLGTTTMNELPVCIVKGPQRTGATCDSATERQVHILASGAKVCERTDGFKVAARTPTADLRVIMIWDETLNSNIQNDATYALNSLKLRVNPGAPAQMLLANKCGGPQAVPAAQLWNLNQAGLARLNKVVDEITDTDPTNGGKFYRLSADDTAEIVATATDANGNWVGDVDFGLIGSTPLTFTKGTDNPYLYLTESGATPSISRTAVGAGAIAGCGAHTRFTINPNMAANKDALVAINSPNAKLKFDKITFNQTVGGVPLTANLTLAVRPGRPSSVLVDTQRIRLDLGVFGDTANQTHVNGANHFEAGDCGRISLAARDADNNIIYDSASAGTNVTVKLRMKNYYTPAASRQLFQPGGLYQVIGSETRLTPITQSTLGWTAHSDQASFNTGNGGVSAYLASDPYENDTISKYVGHETLANRNFNNGVIDALNRFVCFFQEGTSPTVTATLEGTSDGLPYAISGETSTLTINSQPTTSHVIDLRNASGDRICPLANGTGTNLLLPRRKKLAASYVFQRDSDGVPATCSTVGVSSSPATFKPVVTDSVGNLQASYSTPTASVTGSYSSTASGSDFSVVSSGYAGLRQTGTIGINLTAGSITSSKSIVALAKIPRKVSIYKTGDTTFSSSAIVPSNARFELSFRALDEFDNPINDPSFGTDYSMTLALQYFKLVSSTLTEDLDAAHAFQSDNTTKIEDGISPSTYSTPMSFSMLGGFWTASTNNGLGSFWFKNNKKGAITIRARATFTKSGQTPIVANDVDFPITIATGPVTSTIVTQLNTDTALSTNTSTPTVIPARSIAQPYLYSTASYDQYKNRFTSTDPAQNAVNVTCDNQTPAGAVTCSQSATPGVIQVVTNTSGTFRLQGFRGAAGSVVSTDFYPFSVAAGDPSAVRIVPTDGFNFATGIHTAGNTRAFRLELVDNFGNVTTGVSTTAILTWSVGETYPDIPLGGAKIILPTATTCTFTLGVCAGPFVATFRGVSDNTTDGKIAVSAAIASPASTVLGSQAVRVQPATLNFYNVKKQSAGDPIASRQNDASAKFSITVTAHDAFGNYKAVAADTNLKLKIVRPDESPTFFPNSTWTATARAAPTINGLIHWLNETNTSAISNAYVPATGVDTTTTGGTRNVNTTYTMLANQHSLTINNLAFDDPGSYKVLVTDGAVTSSTATSETINFTPSLASLKDFYFDLPASLTLVAGQTSTIRVIARTFYDSALRGLDALLSNNVAGSPYNFVWSTSANSASFTAADVTGGYLPGTIGSDTTLPSTFTFIDGSALVPMQFNTVSAVTPATNNILVNRTSGTGTNKLALVGVQGSTLHRSTLPPTTSVTLTPNALASYDVVVSGLSATPTATLDSRFNVTVTARDTFANPRPGETGLNLIAEKSANTSLVGSASTTTVLRKPATPNNKHSDGFDNAFSNENLNLTTGLWQATGLVYLVPQTVKFKLDGAAVTVNSTNNLNTTDGFITFAPALGTVRDYKIDITETADVTNTGQYRTHGSTAVLVTARDIAGNAVPNIEGALNAATYNWAGANTLALTSEAPVYPTSKSFLGDGTWTTSVNFKATQSFLANTLTITDNYSVAAGADPRTGGNVAPFTVYSRHKDYALDPGAGTSAIDWTVNTATAVKVTARGYDNLPVREFDSKLNTFVFAWGGGGFGAAPSGTQAIFGANTTKTGKTLAFNNGVAFMNITAFKKESIAVSDVTLTDDANSKANGPNKTGQLIGVINVRAGTVNNYLLAANQSIRDADNTTNGQFSLEITPRDAYNNPTVGEAGLAIVTNGGSKTKTTLKSTTAINTQSLDLTTGLDATTGKKTLTGMYYPVPDAAINFGLTNTTATIVPTADMSFNATEKSIVGYAMTVAASQTVGAAFAVTLTPKDMAGNVINAATQTASFSALKSSLEGRLFKLSGPNLSLAAPAGNTTAPTINGTAMSATKNLAITYDANLIGTFTNIILKRAETIAAGNFVFEDNFTIPRTASNSGAIVVVAATPTAIHADEIPSVRAGQQFEVRAFLKDNFGNTSVNGCASGTAGTYAEIGWKDSAGNYSFAAGDVEPSGVFTTTTGKAPDIKKPDATTTVTSTVRVAPDSANSDEMKLLIKLYKKGDNKVRLQACSLTLDRTVSVIEDSTATLVRISKSPTRPTVFAAETEIECLHSGANLASADVLCPTVYSYFWDTYGNTFGDGSAQCAWSGGKAGTDPTTVPTSITGSASTLQVTHSGPVNTSLTCTGPNATTASVLLYGGISWWSADLCTNSTCASGKTLTVNSTAAGSMTSKNPAAGTPMIAKNIQTKMYKGTGNTLVAYASSLATSHQITIDKSAFTPTTGVTNIPSSLTANLLTSGATNSGDIFNFPFSAPYTNKTLSLTMRGMNIVINDITVESGSASSIAFASGLSSNVTPTAGAAITESIYVRDTAANLANCTSINVSVSGGGTHDAVGNGAAIPGNSATFEYNAAVTKTNVSGTPGSFSVSLTFFKAETITMQFTTNSADCGATLTLTQTYTVQPKTNNNMLGRLSSDGTVAPTNHLDEISCSMGAGLAMSCPTVYLHTWDFYGNYVSGTTCDSWAWSSYDASGAGANGVSETPTVTAGAVRSQTLAITTPDPTKGFLDGKIACTRANTQVHRTTTFENDGSTATDIRTIVTGGLKELQITLQQKNASGTLVAATSPISSVQAATDNVKVTEIVAKKRRRNVTVIKNDFVTSATESIQFSTAPVTNGSDTTENNRTITGGTIPLMSSATLDCKFTTDGICRTPADTAVTAQANMTFAIVESIQRKVVLNLRGKSSEFVVQQVTPAAPATVGFQAGRTTANSTPTAGTAVSETIEVRDAFGNKSTCDKIAVSKQSAGSADAPANGGTIPGTATTFTFTAAPTPANVGSGNMAYKNFPVSLTFFRASATTMRFATDTSGTNCGTTAVQFDATYTVAPKTGSDVVARLSTSADTVPTVHTAEIQCPLGAGLQMNCPALYLHTWDMYGNYMSNTTCGTWAWDHYNAVSGATGTSETPTMSAATTDTRSQTLTAAGTASGFIDGKVTCNRTGTGAFASAVSTDVYGGIKEIRISAASVNPAQTFTLQNSGTLSTAITAAANNVQLTELKAFVRKHGADVAKTDFVAGQADTVQVSTAVATAGTGTGAEQARTLTGGAYPLSTTSSFTCSSFDANGICRSSAAGTPIQTMDLNFKVVESVARKVVFSLRGKEATLIVNAVAPALPTSVVFDSGASANAAPAAGTTFTEIIRTKDAFGNISACELISVSVPAGGNHDSPGSASGDDIPGSANTFAYNAAGNIASTGAGTTRQFSAPLTFYKSENITLKFETVANATGCGATAVSFTQTYAVSPKTGTGMLARLSTADATPPTQHTEEIKCALGAGLAMTCPALYVHTWDAYGNYINNSTCDSWSWQHYDSGINGTSETPNLASGNNTRNQTLSATGAASGFIDGRLICARANTAISRPGTTPVDTANTTPIQTVVYGGLKSIQVAATKAATVNPAAAAVNYAEANAITIPTVKAAANNVQITQVKALVRRFGADVAKSDFVAGQNETINVSTTSAGTTGEQNRTLGSGTQPISNSSTVSCSFSNVDGLCKNPANTANNQTMDLNFKLVESAARTVTFNLRGKTATIAVTAVTPANAANAAIVVKSGGTATTSLQVRQPFTTEATLTDAFGNTTNLKADGTDCAEADATASVIHTTPTAGNTNLGAAANYNSGGVYTFNISNTAVTLAGSKNIAVTACGVAATNSANLTFAPGALSTVVLKNSATISSTDTTLAEDRCALQSTGSGVNCSTIYAYFFDQDNNAVSGQSCNWTYAHNATASGVYGAQMTTPTLSSTTSTSSTTVTHSDFIDGNLTCTAVSNNAITRNIALYGGIAKVQLAWDAKSRDSAGAETTTANGTTVTAGDNNLLLSSGSGIKLFGPVKGADTLVPGAGTQAIIFTTTAPNNGGSSSLPTNANTCDFSTTAGVCSTQSYNFNFKTSNVGGTAYQATVSVRGKTATMSGVTVQPANAASLTLTSKISTTVVYTVTTDDEFDVYADVKDPYGNLTDLKTDYATCPTTPTAAEAPVDTTGVVFNSNKSGATADNTLSAASRIPTKISGSVGQYKYSAFKLTGIQSNGSDASSILKFGLCGIATTAAGSTLTLTVKPGKPFEAFLSTTNAATRSDMPDTLCSLNNSGAGATCGPIYAWFYDAQQNLVTSANGGQCTTWSASNIPTGSPAGLTTPNISTAASSSQTFTSTGAFSLTLTCNNTAAGFTAKSVKLRGGIAKVALTWSAKTLDSANAAVSTASGTTVDAQNENLIIDSMTFQTYDFNATPNLVTLAQGTNAETLQITSNASQGPTTATPVIPAGLAGASGETTCNMTDGICTPATAGEIAHNVHKLTLSKAGETGRSVSVTIRGVTATISGLAVNSGAMVAASHVHSIPTTATVDIPVTTGAIELYDAFGNRTQKNCSNLTLAYEYSSDGTTFAAATTGASGNTRSPDNTDPTLPATIAVSGVTTGRYELPTTTGSALKLVKDGTYRLTPTVCGSTLAYKDITVSKGAIAKVKLFASTQTDPFNVTADTGPIHCPHTTATSSTANVSCPNINAYFFDSRGNRVTDASAACTSWDFIKDANSSDSDTLLGLNANTASITPTATNWIDGTLRCNKGGTAGSDLAPQLTIYGGTHSITASYSTTTPTAGNNNVTLSSLTIWQRKLGSTVVAAVARTNELVEISSTATQASTGSPNPIIAGSATTFQCNSAATTGVCSLGTALNISLTKAETPIVSLALRGKSFSTTFTVSPGTASSATLTLATASPWDAGQVVNASFLPKDSFGNATQSGCTTITGSGGVTSPSSDAPAYGTVGAFSTTTGYSITGIVLKNASTQTLSYACNPTTTVSHSQSITVASATSTKVSITSTNSKPTFANSKINQDLKCTLSSATNSNTNLTCPTTYAWGYDDYGNSTAFDTCRWQKADYATSAFGTATDLNGTNSTASLTLTASGALNAQLSCSGKTMLNSNNIYGGVAKIAVNLGQANTQTTSGGITTYRTSATNIKASDSNIVITQVNAYAQREGVDVVVPLVAGTTSLTMAATVSNVEDTTANGTSYNLTASELTCAFSTTTSQCSTPINFTFKKVHATSTTRPQITLDLKSKTAIVDVSPITAGNGASLNLTGWPGTLTSGALPSVTVQVKDAFGNNSNLNPSGTACTGSVVTTGLVDGVFTTGTYANSITSTTVNSSGSYTLSGNIYKAATHNVTLAACGLSVAQTVTVNVGAFARALITTSATAPTSYSCLTGDVCDETLPTCNDATTAQCGPFYVWKFDIGGNKLFTNNDSDSCDSDGTAMSGITVNNTGDAAAATPSATGKTATQFYVTAGTAGKHIAGNIQCTAVTKGNRLLFKAPTRAKPSFKCYPWGIDNTGTPEALCVVTNETGYVISSVNVGKCTATSGTTTDRCNTFDATTQDMANYSVSSHCTNLPSADAAGSLRFHGHRCSVVITGTSNKITPPLWVEAESPDDTKVRFEHTMQVRIPTNYSTTATFANNTNTCLANTNYHSSVAAGCSTGQADSKVAGTSVEGLIFDGLTTDCTTTYPTRRITLQVQANGNPNPFTATPAAVQDTTTNDYTSVNSQDTCASKNLATNDTCKVKLDMTRPYNEIALKIGDYWVRSGEAGRCTATNAKDW